MQIDGWLLTESQLDNRLNKSVHEHRSGEFALLLAMISHDALDFSQFHLPKTELTSPDVSESVLRKELGAGPSQPLAPEQFDMLIGQDNAFKLLQGGLSDIRLHHCLNPEPLNVRDDKLHVPLEVIDNCEPAVRKRFYEKNKLVERPQIDAAAFYDSLTDEAIHQPLHLATA
ncbi:VC2046/SO_2500 family protein [Pseudoalteromonas gelatinilytica]